MLMANATGISTFARGLVGEFEDFDVGFMRQFVSIVASRYVRQPAPPVPAPDPSPNYFGFTEFEFLLAVGAAVILMIMLACLLAALMRRSKRIKEEEAVLLAGNNTDFGTGLGYPGMYPYETDDLAMAAGRPPRAEEKDLPESSGGKGAPQKGVRGGPAPIEIKEEQLKRQIKMFVDQNPEIAAQLMRIWLKGDETSG
jgi:flagellar M-ring protein FliF